MSSIFLKACSNINRAFRWCAHTQGGELGNAIRRLSNRQSGDRRSRIGEKVGPERIRTVKVRAYGRCGKVPINVSALSDARFHEQVKAGTILCARSIKPFERSRPWLRRTRSLWKFNGGKMRCGDAPELRDRAEQATVGEEKVR